MLDVFDSHADSLNSPPANLHVVTPDGCAGIVFPVRARRIWATGTTATGIAAMY